MAKKNTTTEIHDAIRALTNKINPTATEKTMLSALTMQLEQFENIELYGSGMIAKTEFNNKIVDALLQHYEG